MAYDEKVAERVRAYLAVIPHLKIEEKRMFGGRCFMVNDKMCVNVSRENLMCRFEPQAYETVAGKKGFLPMLMKGREMKGYCYVAPEGFKSDKDFEFWIQLCLDYNKKAGVAKKKR